MSVEIDAIAPIVLDDWDDFARNPPRHASAMEPGYIEKFDAKTLFYDVFAAGATVTAVAPPLRTLLPLVAADHMRLDDALPLSAAVRHQMDRTERVELLFDNPRRGQKLSVETPSRRYEATLGAERLDRFAGKVVAFTLSKDNPVEWISDWAQFYVRVHGVNAVLFYDNGSTSYGLDRIAGALSAVPGLDTATVVSWPFKYGPLSAPINGRRKRFDSNYCQMSMMEHAKKKYLGKASCVVNADLDELIVTADGRSVVDHVAETRNGYLLFSGVWVLVLEEFRRLPRYTDFCEVLWTFRSRPCKWVIEPRKLDTAAQWLVHAVKGMPAEQHSSILLRHFMGINTNWQGTGRSQVRKVNEEITVDRHLVRDLDRTFGTAPLDAQSSLPSRYRIISTRVNS